MSAERTDKQGKNPTIPLTSDQAGKAADEITEKWDGKNGLRLDGGILEELIKIYGPDAKMSDILGSLKKETKH
ncbi:MAG: hypothetical protein NC918_08520 [Candidatus Omnitrophica bacterium]|nr:hypothetical protein [Candidatus Omnitrophota bacterium]